MFAHDSRSPRTGVKPASSPSDCHLGLVSIHPFEDGNGRTARLIADMVLDLTDTSILGMVSVSTAIDASGSDYVNALRRTQGLRYVDERGRLQRVGAGRNTRYVLPRGVRKEYAEFVVSDPRTSGEALASIAGACETAPVEVHRGRDADAAVRT